MSNINDNESINKLYAYKFSNYLDLMKISGCSEEEINDKLEKAKLFKNLSLNEKAKIVSDDYHFLKSFTEGIELRNDSGSLYKGLNEEITRIVICDMASINNLTILPKDYLEEVNSDTVKLSKIKDRVALDINDIIKDNKKLFFTGNGEEFHNEMKKRFNSDEELQEFSDIVDESVFGIDLLTNQKLSDEKEIENEKKYKEIINNMSNKKEIKIGKTY